MPRPFEWLPLKPMVPLTYPALMPILGEDSAVPSNPLMTSVLPLHVLESVYVQPVSTQTISVPLLHADPSLLTNVRE